MLCLSFYIPAPGDSWVWPGGEAHDGWTGYQDVVFRESVATGGSLCKPRLREALFYDKMTEMRVSRHGGRETGMEQLFYGYPPKVRSGPGSRGRVWTNQSPGLPEPGPINARGYRDEEPSCP